MEKIFLSTVIPLCDGRSSHLRCLLESFSQQDCNKDLFELVLIKNKLLKDEKEIDKIIRNYVGKFNIQVLKIDAPENPEKIPEKEKWLKLWGMNDARNQGINKAKGDYVFILDMDFLIMPNFISKLYNFINNLDKNIFVLYPTEIRIWQFNWKGSLQETLKQSTLSSWKCGIRYGGGHLLEKADNPNVNFENYIGKEGFHIMPKRLAEIISFNEELGFHQAPKLEFQSVIKKCKIKPLYKLDLYIYHIEHGSSFLEKSLLNLKGTLSPDRHNFDYYVEHRRNDKPEEIKKVLERIKGVI